MIQVLSACVNALLQRLSLCCCIGSRRSHTLHCPSQFGCKQHSYRINKQLATAAIIRDVSMADSSSHLEQLPTIAAGVSHCTGIVSFLELTFQAPSTNLDRHTTPDQAMAAAVRDLIDRLAILPKVCRPPCTDAASSCTYKVALATSRGMLSSIMTNDSLPYSQAQHPQIK